MASYHFEAYQGESFDIEVSVTDDAGDAFDLTGYTVTWRIGDEEKTEGDGVTITDAASGELTLSLSTSDTDVEEGEHRHELRIANGETLTVLAGTMTVLDSLFEGA